MTSADSACDVSPHGQLVARGLAFRLSSWGVGFNARPLFWALCTFLFLVTLAPRLICPNQPLVENFIDRQVHTAMIARNLARGGSLLYPEIDIGPFPAYYMLEFPAYPWLVETLAAFFSMPLDAMGRVLSACAVAGACCFFFDLVRRRNGTAVGLISAAVLAMMPVTIRFGRAFQPDSLMIAALIVAVWATDRWSEAGKHSHLAVAALATSVVLLLKVISAYVLLPIAYLAWCREGWSMLQRPKLWLALALAVAPALAWYVHAWSVASSSATVSTPFWHIHKWMSLDRIVSPTTYRDLAFFVGLRVLTPIGVMLAIVGALVRADDDSSNTCRGGILFHVWLASLITYLPILIRKLDHEHYYLALAPVAAVFIGRAIIAIAEAPLARRCYVSGRIAAVTLALMLFASDWLACKSTFREPMEWRNVTAAAEATRTCTPPDSLVAAHSSLLFYAGRRGFSFAYGRDEIGYLLSTWRQQETAETPEHLLEFYRQQGAEYFVELLGTNRERDNPAFFEYVRTHYEILRMEPGRYMVACLRNGQKR